MNYPEPGTVRWYISEFVKLHMAGARAPYLEVGSLREDHKWWRNIRPANTPPDDWIGLDMQPGPNVDLVFDLVSSPVPDNLKTRFGTIVCTEVLEHVSYPLVALSTLREMLEPGGKIIITVPFAFPIHNYPDDYWRFAPSGLRALLMRAGFVKAATTQLNEKIWELNDHGGAPVKRLVPMHIGAVAYRG